LQADFAVIAIDRPHQLPSYDPIDTLVFASSGRDVVLTVVAGKELFSEGRVMTVDEERLAARINEIAAKLGAANME
jgi:5-methylthioadenosine/S-adenosylhomocysteine deaminase